jgi:putative addiction module component (TIGR02574 family)
MIKPLSEVTREAMELPVDQRLSLVRTILGTTESNPTPSHEVDQAWEDEIADRIQSVQSGQATGRSWDEILKDIDTQLSA